VADEGPDWGDTWAELTVAYGDGRWQSNSDYANDGPAAFVLDEVECGRGSGPDGGSEWWGVYWAAPLPPVGPVTFRLRWPAAGVDGEAVVDGATISVAASTAAVLWVPETES
jgi:hypothetical protein